MEMVLLALIGGVCMVGGVALIVWLARPKQW